MSETNGNKNCLYPECKRGAVCRGLCNHHYQQAQRLVHSGRTTWDKLIEAGKCSGVKQHHSPTSWFMEGVK